MSTELIANASTELVSSFIRSRRALDYSAHTVVAYAHDLAEFVSIVSEDVTCVSKVQIRSYVRELTARKYSPSTVHRKLSSVRALYKWLGFQGEIKTNPLRGFRGPLRVSSVPKAVPSLLEMQRLFAIANTEALTKTRAAVQRRAMLELFYSTGARLSELCDLKVGDIDFPGRSVLLRGKGKRERLGFMGEECVIALQAHLGTRYRRPHAAVFTSSTRRRISQRGVQYAMKHLFDRAGLDQRVSVHSIRHAFATHLMDAGAGIREIQELLGHKSLSTTRRYTQISKSRVMAVYRSAHPRAQLHLVEETVQETRPLTRPERAPKVEATQFQ